METILYLYEKCRALVNRGMPVSVLKEDKIFERIIAIKYEVPNKELERFDEYHKDIDVSTIMYWKETVKGGISLWQSNILA